MTSTDSNRTPLGVAENKTTGKGIPPKSPQKEAAQVDRQPTQRDASAEASLHLPHERDQSSDMTGAKPDPLIEHGLKDTSKLDETDRAYKRQK